jgi:hypothetical protein
MDLLFISISGNKSTPILIIIACPPIYKFLQIQYLSCQPSRPFFSAKKERKKGLGLAETVEVKLQAMEEPRPYLPSEGSPGHALGLNEKVKILTSPPFPPRRCEKIMLVPSCRTWINIRWPSQVREPEALRLVS